MSSKNQDKVTGRIKEAAGALTGNDKMKREGKLEQASADVKEGVENAIDSVKNAISGKDKKKDR